MQNRCICFLLFVAIEWGGADLSPSGAFTPAKREIPSTAQSAIIGGSHPWQLSPANKNRHQKVNYRNPKVNHEDFFMAAKRKLILQQQKASLTPAQLEAFESAEKMNRWAKMIADIASTKNAAAAAAAANVADVVDPRQIEYKGPPAFGGPRTISNTFNPHRESTEDELIASGQAGGLPFSRKAIVRDYNTKKKYRLPIPDSERQYRKPVNESILKAYHAVISNETDTIRTMSNNNPGSFRALIEMIETLMSPPTQRASKVVHKVVRKPAGLVKTDVVDVVKRQKRVHRAYNLTSQILR